MVSAEKETFLIAGCRSPFGSWGESCKKKNICLTKQKCAQQETKCMVAWKQRLPVEKSVWFSNCSKCRDRWRNVVNVSRVFSGHNNNVGAIVFHPEATKSLSESACCMASCSQDGAVKLWSLDRQVAKVLVL